MTNRSLLSRRALGRAALRTVLSASAVRALGGCLEDSPTSTTRPPRARPSSSPSAPAPTATANWEKRIAQLEALGAVYTEAAPGPWPTKTASHVPKTSLAGRTVTVVVEHPMTPADEDAAVDASAAAHYITTIWARSGDGEVLALWELSATDPAPPSFTFTPPADIATIVVYEHCTLHGVWSSSPVVIP